MSERVRSERSALRHGAVLSASCFIADTLRDFCRGNRRVGITSLGLRSKEGMMFYMPVRHVSPGQYLVVDDLPLNLAARKKIRAIVKKTKKSHCLLKKMVDAYTEALDAAAHMESDLPEKKRSHESLHDVHGVPEVEFGLHEVCRLALIRDVHGADLCGVCGICQVPEPTAPGT